ncbi:Uncharacterised protein [Mycobacteroides abscessus subsp. abscessus]|nr:Uncharacterised protein [Mycobacteroides abscessus subsp. abscessus]
MRRASPDRTWLRAASISIPNTSSPARASARSNASFSPAPAVNEMTSAPPNVAM